MQQACDVALLIPQWSDLKDWRDRTHLYVHQRPQAAAPGSRVWLCKDRRLIYSYRIDDFLELRGHLPGEADAEDAGWALVVSDGKRVNRDLDNIADPDGVAARWMQGFRYLEPGAKAFVKAPRRPRLVQASPVEPRPAAVVEAEPEAPTAVRPSWATRAARRLGRGP